MRGFTLFETMLAMTIVSLVSVTSIYILFLSLNLRDLTQSTTISEESIRVFERSIREAVLGSQSITGNSGSLFLRSQSICWSFVYDPSILNVKYAKVSQTGCTPDLNPTSLFFPSSSRITALSFSFLPISTGGNLVRVAGTIQTVLPFDVYQTSFSESFVNLIDQ